MGWADGFIAWLRAVGSNIFNHAIPSGTGIILSLGVVDIELWGMKG